ncbi:integrin alpha-M-like protein [Labeo rohita]|uniref:Integrin alpha-M-like protein n=1 Tax=Labeo rohita TaxID=84645 RepID=A0A498MSF2_LABRO|nr:integrin alpha-M-like protein [Labeo rohita]
MERFRGQGSPGRRRMNWGHSPAHRNLGLRGLAASHPSLSQVIVQADGHCSERLKFVFSDVVLVGMAGQRGRFGSSLASPADLDGDGFRDVLIGAPLEEDGQGSIYIFNGGVDQINPTYSQRIGGSSVQSGLRFFGISLSQSSLDQSGDRLPDIAVGSMGAVQLLRSRPIMFLNTQACPEDALNPLSNQLNFTSEGLPSKTMQNLRPVFHPEIKTTTEHNVNFEINCGTDNLCVDDLRMDFNFSGSANIEVGIMQEINVTVFVENRGENSYNTRFILNYPFGLSYRRITYKQGRVECVSLDGVQGVKLGETTCFISKPILKDNSQVVFEITFSINKESTLGRNVTFKAEVSSGNDKHSSSRDILKEKAIGVKYAIYTALIRHENSTIHINFTSGKKDLMKPVQQIIKNCSVAACVEFSCDVTLLKNERILYNITGNVSSGWIEQTGLRAAVFQLVSSASLDYDKSKYVFFSSDSQETAPSVQINTQVEVYEEVDLTKEIIGGVIGGLLLLALITAALYKAGFFKSQYKQMLEEAKGDAGGQPNMPQ